MMVARTETFLLLNVLALPWHDEGMKAKPEYVEGPDAWTRFRGAMQKVMGVSHEELHRRIEAEKKKAALNPNKRGPKPKLNPSASHGPAA